ncbi:MAG: hypothetical protein JW747_00770 [Candidatus Aminicenantes bacterium]|nr:hypothetical protein [Candidatus Aminicenantes bacterium]
MKILPPSRASSRRSFRSAAFVLPALLLALHALSARDFAARDRRPGERIVPLFTAGGEERPGPVGAAPWTLRSRPVEINPLFLEDGEIDVGTRVVISPFERTSFTAVLLRSGVDVNGVRSFLASIDGTEHGYLLLSSADGCILGLADIPEWGLRFELVPDMELGLHIVREIDPRAASEAELEDGPPLLPPADGLGAEFAAADGEVNVDLMIVYTPAAADFASRIGGIALVVSQAVQSSQLAFDNSGAGIRLRLVFSNEIDYVESDSSYTDLDRLTRPDDGFMDEVHSWRNLHGADMVDLLAEVEDVGGLAWQLNFTSGRPHQAFSLVRVQQAASGYTLVHELGHNLGCHHRKDQAVQPGPGIFSYSAGWRWAGDNGNRYCSVMSYTDDWNGYGVTRVGHFSSPLVTHQGAPTGDAADGDNARTLRETKGIVSSYRDEAGGDPWLTIRVTEGGTTDPAPGSYTYPRGSVVLVTARPSVHHIFNGWSGSASGAANPLSITMDESKSVTANFLRLIYIPLNARGEKVLNRSLSQAEYINVLNWEANPDNDDIIRYRIYRVEGEEKTLLTYVDADVFSYRERGVEKDTAYTYWITAVNSEEREGEPAVVVVP